jgi:hypothetical protein
MRSYLQKREGIEKERERDIVGMGRGGYKQQVHTDNRQQQCKTISVPQMVHKKLGEFRISAQLIALPSPLVDDFDSLEETVAANISHPRILLLDRFRQPLREIQTHIQSVLLRT